MVTTVVDGVEMKDTLNAHWKQNKGSFGFRMLQKMGWSEEKGLGKNEDGMVASVKVKRREDGLGLGMEAVKDDVVGSKSWNHTVSGFNAVLELLKTNYNANNQGSENDSESSKKKSKKSKKEKKEKKEKKPRPIISVGIK